MTSAHITKPVFKRKLQFSAITYILNITEVVYNQDVSYSYIYIHLSDAFVQ